MSGAHRFSAADADGPSAAARVGRFLARRRRWVIGIWLAVLVAAGALAPVFQRSLGAPSYAVDGSGSAHADQLITEHLGDIGEQDAVVFHSDRFTVDDQQFSQATAAVLSEVRSLPWTTDVLGPGDPGGTAQVSKDRHTAFAVVGVAGDASQRATRAHTLTSRVARIADGSAVQAEITGFTPVNNDLVNIENRDLDRAELIGIPIALAVLLLALGSVASAVLPLAVAGMGVLLTYGVLGAITSFMSFDSLAPSIAVMVGLGVGIDYSMFLVSRFREELTKAGDVDLAAGQAVATAGRTVLASGVVVMLSLGSLGVVGSHLFREMALAAALAVLCAMLVALTLLPAALAALGSRLRWGSLPRRFQPPEVTGRSPGSGFWGRWVRTVMRRPILSALAVGAVLLLAAAPLLGMRYGINLGLGAVTDTSSGRGLALLTEHFDPGLVSPTEVVVVNTHHALDAADLAGVADLTRALQRDPAVGSVVSVTSLGGGVDPQDAPLTPQALAALRANPATGPLLAQIFSQDGRATVVDVAPKVPIDSPAADALVERIRQDLAPAALGSRKLDVAVGGIGAVSVDMSHEVSSRLPLVIGLVLALSFLYLLVVFRSLLLAAKAIVMNLLATGAAFGLLVIVFQHGVGQGLLGFTSPGYIQVYLPIVVFALLFGLSMDYEVFLVHRIQESWLRSGDNARAVAEGIEHTARPISAAAAIMVAVFGAFLVASVLELKQFGFGLAVAIAVDATLVRLILVPALMDLAGGWNWWLPAWLERMLPRLRLADAESGEVAAAPSAPNELVGR